MAMQRDNPAQARAMVATTVPVSMCCSECAAMMHAALRGVRGVRGVIVDLRNQQITVTGYPSHAGDLLQQLRSFGAPPARTHQLIIPATATRGGDRVVYGETRYARTHCPVYRAGASDRTHYINPT